MIEKGDRVVAIVDCEEGLFKKGDRGLVIDDPIWDLVTVEFDSIGDKTAALNEIEKNGDK